MVADDVQDTGRERRIHNLGGGVCVGTAIVWVGRRVFGERIYNLVSMSINVTGLDRAVRDNYWTWVRTGGDVWSER